MMNCLLWLFYLRGVNFLNNHTHKFTNPTEFLFLIIITISALTSANLQSIQRTKSSKPQTWGLNNLIHSIIHLAIVMNLHFTLCFFFQKWWQETKYTVNRIWFFWPPITGRISFIISWTKRKKRWENYVITWSGSSDHQSQEGSPLLSPEQRDRKVMNILVQPSLVPFTISQEKDLILNILNKEQRKYKIRDLVSLVFSDFSPQEVSPRFFLKVNVKNSIHETTISLTLNGW